MPHKTDHGTYVIFEDQPEGNAMSIISITRNMLKQIWSDDPEQRQIRIENYMEQAMSGDYEHLKKVSQEAVPGLLEFGLSKDYLVRALENNVKEN